MTPQARQQAAAVPPVTAAQPMTAPATAAANNQVDTSDVATLNDALGSAGVDLRAEEESLQRSSDTHQIYRLHEDRSRKQPATPNFDIRYLGPTMRTIGTSHKVTKIPDDTANYLALALRARLSDLVKGMVKAAQHRTDAQFDRPASTYPDAEGTPMWSIRVRADVGRQLAALEKAEKEEEMRVRRERKERAELAASHAANLAAQAAGGGAAASPAPAAPGAAGAGSAMVVDGDDGAGGAGGEGQAKKKRKKEGPGVTAKNMSEDVRKKMSNAVASQAAGIGGKYAWMTAATSAATPKPKPAPAAATPAPASTPTPSGSNGATTNTGTAAGPTPATPATTTAPAANTTGAGSSWARPYVSTTKPATAKGSEDDARMAITMRDAMFVIENERGHGGGRGAALGWT
ncbi:hypothetical protein CONPUDRAFT_64243 [Coniophora puteana RWD-64-598 SS2]|uniref:Transcription initiation factor TFIID subunit 4 n=1 Tax=Coniophora puteana (strain RWD-64-598) TaxID=741705 RepID=A0A5M3MCM7_CONPW|nr:uncharacterized protein CONPUDRAFT_64243 [Coniophora puteana RWD-64-598 SS2]EIW76401.1 hypothetical protein CONPUDRAFT_64243 [Coniophora puteana RWD-64-598 SS2]